RCVASKSTPSRYQNWPSSLTEPDLSALPCGAARDVRFGPKADIGFLFDHLVGLREKRWGDGYAESLGCPEVDHQLEFGRCLHRQVAGLFALKDSVNVPCRESIQLNTIRPIGEQATGGGKEPLVVDCRQLVPCRERDDQITMQNCQTASGHDQAAVWSAR